MYHHYLILIILFFNVVSFQFIARANQFSFAVDLIHRDSPESPFYNQSLTPSELLTKDVMRYRTGINSLNSSSAYTDDTNMVPSHQEKRKLLESQIMMTGRNDYVIKFYVGSNRVPVFLYVDLTSNFVWTKCGMSKGSQLPYRPRESSLFSEVAFDSLFCSILSDNIKVPKTSGECSFKYTDTKRHSEANGVIVRDIFHFSESKPNAHKINFGCDDSEPLDHFDIGALGLGRGPISFIWQLQDVIYKFSYCLLYGSISKIIFGDLPNEIERTLVASPLQPIIGDSYYLNLERVEVGNSQIVDPFEGGMIQIRIDLGTKWTYLEERVYEHVENKVREIVKANPIYLPDYGLCYEKEVLEGTDFSIIFHFKRKATTRMASLRKVSITINSKSVFAQENVENGVKHCMTIRKLGDGETHSVLGSLAQMGHVMQFDIKEGRVSFAAKDCSEF